MGEAFLTRRGGGTDTSDTTLFSSAQLLQGVTGINNNGDIITGAISDCSEATLSTDTIALDNTNGKLFLSLPNNPTTGLADDLYAVTSGADVVTPYASLANAIGLTGDKLAYGKSVLGVTGTFSSDASAISNDIISGKTVYIKGASVTGVMPLIKKSITLANGESSYIDKGYHDGTEKVTGVSREFWSHGSLTFSPYDTSYADIINGDSLDEYIWDSVIVCGTYTYTCGTTVQSGRFYLHYPNEVQVTLKDSCYITIGHTGDGNMKPYVYVTNNNAVEINIAFEAYTLFIKGLNEVGNNSLHVVAGSLS